MKTANLYILTVSLFSLACSTVKVTHITKDNATSQAGLRYSLGKPFIQVIPDPSSGVYSAQLVYIPDQEQTYASESQAIFSKSTLEIEVDEAGLLKKITLGNEQDATVGEATKGVAEVGKSFFETQKKQQDEDEKALIKAQDDVESKKVEITAAEAERKSLEDTYKGADLTKEIKEKIRVKEVELIKLRAQLEDLQKKLDDATADARSSGALNSPQKSGSVKKAWGPVLFSIIDTCDPMTGVGEVKLVAVKWTGNVSQLPFETYGEISGKTGTAVVSSKIDVEGSSEFKVKFKAGKATIEKIILKEKYDSIEPRILLTAVGDDSVQPGDDVKKEIKISILEGNKALKIEFNKEFPKGEYELAVSVKIGETTKTASISLTVE